MSPPPPAPPPAPGPGAITRAVDVIRDARRWILGGGLAGLLVGLILAVAAPSPYEATATVLLRGTDGFVALAEDGVGDPWTAVLGPRPDYATEEAVLSSREVLAAAADSLDLEARFGSWGTAVRHLEEAVRVERVQGRVAAVRARASDPGRAAETANAVVDAYLARHWSEQWRIVGRDVAARRGSRALNDAVPPESRAGPGPLALLGLGLLGGLLAGAGAGATASLASPRLRHPWQAAGAAGHTAMVADAGGKAWLPAGWLTAAGSGATGTEATDTETAGDPGPYASVVVAPVGRDVDPLPAARRLARGVHLGGREAAVLDLTGWAEGPEEDASDVVVVTPSPEGLAGPEERGPAARAARLRERIGSLSGKHGLLLVAVPGPGSFEAAALADPERPAVLVAAGGRTRKREWRRALRELRQLGLPLVASVFHRPG